MPVLRISASCRPRSVRPSASPARKAALVNKGEIYVANGDLQMNLAQMERNPNVKIFTAGQRQGERSAPKPSPYVIGTVRGRRK